MTRGAKEHLRTIESFLEEPVSEAEVRERHALGRLIATAGGGIVLFGAGRLGRRCADLLRRGGLLPLAFCDNNPALEGTQLDGVPVLSPRAAARQFGSTALFVVAIWTGTSSEPLSAKLAFLESQGCMHVTTFPLVFWAFGAAWESHYTLSRPSSVLSHAEPLSRLALALCDVESLKCLEDELSRRLHGQFSTSAPAPAQYFPEDLVCIRQDEVFIDGGAYNGDTLRAFVSAASAGFRAYHAFEPDPDSFARLLATRDEMPPDIRARIHLYPAALGAEPGEMAFAAEGRPTSRRDDGGLNRVRVESLDQHAAVRESTFLKMDLEGEETAALQGALGLLQENQPSVAVCVYHQDDDLWKITDMLMTVLRAHRFHLRTHGVDGWETVFYALRKER